MVSSVLVRDKITIIQMSFLAHLLLCCLLVLFTPSLWAQQVEINSDISDPVSDKTLTEEPEQNKTSLRQQAEEIFSDPQLIEQSCPVDVPDYFDEQLELKQNSWTQKSVDWLVGSRDSFSTGLVVAARGMDDFFGGEESIDEVTEANGTYFRISVSQRFDKSGEITVEEKIKLKLDLPRAENRMKIVFESDPNDLDSLDERNRNIPTEEVRIGDESGSTGALSFLVNEGKFWRINAEPGLKTSPLEPFFRLKMRRNKQLDDDWLMRFRQSFYYFHGDGFGERSQLYFERPINENYYFRNKMEIQWQDEDNRFEFAEILSTYHYLDNRHTIDYDVGIIGENRPVPRVSSYFVRSTLRRRLYRHWLFASLIPELYFPRDEGFKLMPSITLRLEVIFADENYRH